MERHERLKQARVDAGFASAADAARRLGMPYGTYSGHENGLRGITDADLQRYARAFKAPLSWLAFGRQDQLSRSTLNVMGVLGRQSVIKTDPKDASGFWHNEKDFGTVNLSFLVPDGLVAITVDGWDMCPAYRANDVIVLWKEQRSEITEFIGETAVVKLSSGMTYLCEISRGSRPGCFSIHSFNLRPMQDVAIEWVGEIFACIPGMQISKRIEEIYREGVAAAGRRALLSKPG